MEIVNLGVLKVELRTSRRVVWLVVGLSPQVANCDGRSGQSGGLCSYLAVACLTGP